MLAELYQRIEKKSNMKLGLDTLTRNYNANNDPLV